MNFMDDAGQLLNWRLVRAAVLFQKIEQKHRRWHICRCLCKWRESSTLTDRCGGKWKVVVNQYIKLSSLASRNS